MIAATILALLAGNRSAVAAGIDWTCAETAQSGAGCGLATCPDIRLGAADALAALRSAVGIRHCARCRCDVDASGSVSVLDAMRILKKAAGQSVDLACPSCTTLTPVVGGVAATVQEDVVHWSGFDLESASDGSVVVAWNGPIALHAQAFDAELTPKFPPVTLATGSGGGSDIRSVALCARPAGAFVAAWRLATPEDQPVPHDYPNLGDAWFARVDAAGTADQPAPVNGDENGTQAPIAIDCSAVDGAVSLAWVSRCEGEREFQQNAVTPFSPEGCPADGVYVQTVAADGIWSARQNLAAPTFSATSFYARFAALRGGGLVLDAAGHYLRVDAGGNLDDVGESGDGYFGDGSLGLDCGAGAARCVITRSAPLVVNAIDGDNPNRTSDSLLLEDVVEEPDTGPEYSLVTVGPAAATTACDRDGHCLSVWVRERISYGSDYEDHEPLNIVAQGFDVYSGELGPRMELFNGYWVGESQPVIANVAPGRFVLALRTSGSTISLETIAVE